jgi:hypothetical protein
LALAASLGLVFCLPEAFDQRLSVGVFWIRGVAISPADVLSLVILVGGGLGAVASGRLAYTRTTIPLLIFTLVILVQAFHGFAVNEPREVLKDLRPIVGWLCILGIAQFVRTPDRKRLWARWGTGLVLWPPVVVLVLMVGMWSLGIVHSTFSSGSEGRVDFVNSWPIFLGTLTAGNLWFRAARRRNYWLFLGALVLLVVSWMFSQSRASFAILVAVVSILLFTALRRGCLGRLLVRVAVPAGVAFWLVGMVIPVEGMGALDRVWLYVSRDEAFEGHDSGRFAAMQQVADDFELHPLEGVGLGKVYYRPPGPWITGIGDRLSSASDSLLTDLAGKAGILGVLTFLWLLMAFSLQLWRVRRRMVSPQIGLERAFVEASLVAMPIVLFMSVFGNDWWMYRIPPLQMAVWFTTIDALDRTHTRQEYASGAVSVPPGSGATGCAHAETARRVAGAAVESI